MMLMSLFNRRAAALLMGGMLIFGCSLSARGQQAQLAQDSGAPPADIGNPGSPDVPPMDNSPDAPMQGGSDEAGLVLRVQRLEDQIRQMNGQIQQMQYDNHRLEDQLRKFQDDVDYRFQEGGRGRLRHEDSGAAAAPVPPASDAGAPETSAPSRGDAFDPSSDPNAPGAPHPLGSTPEYTGAPPGEAPPETAERDPDAPLDLPSAGFRTAPDADASTHPPSQPETSGAPATTPGGTVIASREGNPVKEEFDVGLGYFRQKDYDSAEKSFSAFLEKNPKSRWTSDALYYLGETYYQRGRPREAAEQYLKISTNYAESSHAPEAMLRLGESLQALGAKEQACATFSEVPHKYPNASAALKAGAEREAKRAQC